MNEWEMDGKPALILLHMQQGILGTGAFIEGFHEAAVKAVKDSGMMIQIQALLKAFRDRKLPVIFVNVLPNPIGTLPAYGKLWEINSATKPESYVLANSSSRAAVQVIPELGRKPEEPLLLNWLLGSLTNSGLDTILKLNGVKTLVLAGFAAHVVVYSTAVQAADLWYSVIIPRDASASLPHEKQAYDAVMDVMAPIIAKVTTAEDVIQHL